MAGEQSSDSFSVLLSLHQFSFFCMSSLSSGHMACLCEGTFPFRGSLVISVWSRWHAASHHPLGANKKRRRCTEALDSESPLVHSTQITKLAGSEPDLDRTAEEADLICLLADGSPITHSHPPASHVGMEQPPTARLERACRRRRRWLLLNMKCRSVGMSRLFGSGEARMIDSPIWVINRGAFYHIHVCFRHSVKIWSSSLALTHLMYYMMPRFIPLIYTIRW